MRKLNYIILLCAIFTLPASCITFASEKLVYSIRDCSFSNIEISFTLKNTGIREISSFDIYVEFCNADTSNYDTDVTVIKKHFDCNLQPNDSDLFSIKLSGNENPFDSLSDEFENAVNENQIYIQKIYIYHINFSDGSQFSDKYGSWSF